MKLFLLAILLAVTAHAAIPNVDQAARWRGATISPKRRMALDVAVAMYQRNQYRYEAIADMKPGTVPPQVLFCLHLRESDCNFKCSPAQGDPLTRRSTHVPRGRIPDKEPPYSFQESAADSYFNVDRLDLKNWKTVKGTLDACTGFNGWGPEYKGVPSSYVWGATSVQRPGKYVRDGVWSSTAVDSQLGVAALLKAMQERGVKLPFAP